MILIKTKYFYYVNTLAFLLLACNNKHQGIMCFEDKHYHVCLHKETDSSYFISCSSDTSQSRWDIRQPVYQFIYSDISNDGQNNILVGVTKKTRFDPVERNRIFVFKIYEDQIRPLWLGSRLGMPTYRFFVRSESGTNYLISIEKEKDGSFAAAKYIWDHFGFKFITYEKRNCTLEELKKTGYEV